MSERSARARIILSRDTALGLVVVLLASAICVGLGLWQYHRFEGKREAAQIVRTHAAADPVSLPEAMPQPDQPLPETAEWTQVRLEGQYCTDPDCVLYVRNRPLDGDVGFWQLVPFETTDGQVLLVVRGWVPIQGAASEPQDPPAVPEGTETLTVRLRPAEETLADRSNPPGQVQTVTPADIAATLPALDGELVTGAYGELTAEDPAGEQARALPAPETSLGPHLSYAFQWWIFALFFPAALIYRTRKLIQEAEDEETPGPAAVDTPESPEGPDGGVIPAPARTRRRPGAARPPSGRRPRGHDEEEEDALIDQQGR